MRLGKFLLPLCPEFLSSVFTTLILTFIAVKILNLAYKLTCFVVYGCETWCLTLRVENKLRLFQNKLTKEIFGPKKEEIPAGMRILHDEELLREIMKGG
jgi:hypothetical protein